MKNLQIKNIRRKVKDMFDNSWIRFALLIVCGAIGIALYRYLWDPLSCLLKINGPKENYIYIHSILLGLPVFFCLWWFRTRDVRQQIHDAGQQIDKTETQIQQNSLFNGIANLSDKDPLKIDMGVAQLLELSKLNPAHDKTIRLAFIRRLKKCPLTKDEIRQGAERLSYAQYIFEWITDKEKEASLKKKVNLKKEANLKNCRLDCQEFTNTEEKKNVFYNIVKSPLFSDAIITCTRCGLVLTESEGRKILRLDEQGIYGMNNSAWFIFMEDVKKAAGISSD